jgi:hypothetical protein
MFSLRASSSDSMCRWLQRARWKPSCSTAGVISAVTYLHRNPLGVLQFHRFLTTLILSQTGMPVRTELSRCDGQGQGRLGTNTDVFPRLRSRWTHMSYTVGRCCERTSAKGGIASLKRYCLGQATQTKRVLFTLTSASSSTTTPLRRQLRRPSNGRHQAHVLPGEDWKPPSTCIARSNHAPFCYVSSSVVRIFHVEPLQPTE